MRGCCGVGAAATLGLLSAWLRRLIAPATSPGHAMLCARSYKAVGWGDLSGAVDEVAGLARDTVALVRSVVEVVAQLLWS